MAYPKKWMIGFELFFKWLLNRGITKIIIKIKIVLNLLFPFERIIIF